jgi:hypothetical protein
MFEHIVVFHLTVEEAKRDETWKIYTVPTVFQEGL